jgi:hypothetical protein
MYYTIQAEGFIDQMEVMAKLILNKKNNMTAEEKAKVLFQRFLPWSGGKVTGDIRQNTIECALIAVDELLHYSKQHGFIGLTEFYEEVKTEIQKL